MLDIGLCARRRESTTAQKGFTSSAYPHFQTTSRGCNHCGCTDTGSVADRPALVLDPFPDHTIKEQ